MKRYVFLMATLMVMPALSWAQNSKAQDNSDAELEQMYQAGNKAMTGGGPAGAEVQATQGSNPIVILNQASPTATSQQVQKQPTTNIEATPLTESRADQIRKARQDVEVQTELKIVEKLEQSRMDDEKRRADVLFGDKFNNLNNSQPLQPQQAVAAPAPAPVVVAAPVSPIQEEAVAEEIKASKEDLDAEKKKDHQLYVTGLIGVGEYPDAINVKGNFAGGFSVGEQFNKRMLVEGSFMYSNYQVEKVCNCYVGPYPTITDMDQYSLSAIAKWQILSGSFKPVIGAVASYTYRQFTDTQFYSTANQVSSQAFDAGLLAGADFELTDDFALTTDFRYMWNVTSKTNTQFQQSFIRPALGLGTPIEQLSYYTFTVGARFTF